jgi:predicted nuclease of predicted toxin-antitoxin system
MKLLLGPRASPFDHQAPGRCGIVAEHVGNLGMAAATDEAILEVARQRPAVVVTLDADFHQLLAISRATMPSVVRIRIEGLKRDQVANILAQVINLASAELDAGALVCVTETRIRVRSLPIGG